MFRVSSAHLQEDTVAYMQHMILSLCKQVSGRIDHSPVYRVTVHMLHVYNCILLKMST